MKSLSQPKESNLICGICHNTIIDPSKAFQSKFLLIPACEECTRKFSEENLEMMLNMFLVYGGYFGQNPRRNLSVKALVKRIDEVDNEDGRMIEEINIRMMHTALIHGIPPEKYLSELEDLL